MQVEVILMEKKVKVTEKDLEVAFGYKKVENSRSQAEDWNRGQVEGERGWAMRGWKWLPGPLWKSYF